MLAGNEVLALWDEKLINLCTSPNSPFYCFLRYPDDYEKVVLRGANTNGDSDSIACIGGSISGAYFGINAIPDQWVKEIENSEYLGDLAIRLAIKKERMKGGNGEWEKG